MPAKTPKRVFGALRPVKGQKAHRVSVSLYQAHKDILTQRETELNIGRSALFQLLLEIDERQSILRCELIQRLRGTTSNFGINQERNTSHEAQEVAHLEHQQGTHQHRHLRKNKTIRMSARTQIPWIRYYPRQALFGVLGLSPEAEVAHRRISDFIWCGGPWPVPDSARSGEITRVPRKSVFGVQ